MTGLENEEKLEIESKVYKIKYLGSHRASLLNLFTHISILLNIMFHAPMGRFQLELIYYFTWPKPRDRRNFSSHKTCYKCCINDKKSTGKKHTTVGWDDGGKIGKIIN